MRLTIECAGEGQQPLILICSLVCNISHWQQCCTANMVLHRGMQISMKQISLQNDYLVPLDTENTIWAIKIHGGEWKADWPKQLPGLCCKKEADLVQSGEKRSEHP
jgi:hypothetical protein